MGCIYQSAHRGAGGRTPTGDAIVLFMAYTGVPANQVRGNAQGAILVRHGGRAPTLRYDHAAILGNDASVPTRRATHVAVPTLVIYRDASYPFMSETALALSQGNTACAVAGPGRSEPCGQPRSARSYSKPVLCPVSQAIKGSWLGLVPGMARWVYVPRLSRVPFNFGDGPC